MNTTNRQHKDGLFRMLFSEKAELLSLYNALNGTNYNEINDLIIITIKDVVFIGHKNDASFIIHDQLGIYEHQSTYCGNMPLRNLIYIGKQYAALVAEESLYSSAIIKLPNPHFVVFYNGKADKPEREIAMLSDAYKDKTCEPNLELKVLMLNINEGYNVKLMEACPKLGEYAKYVHATRKYDNDETIDADTAIRLAVEECIQNNVLAEFLLKHREEVETVCIEEYNQQKHEEDVARVNHAKGHAEGLELGIEQTIKIIKLSSEGKSAQEITTELSLPLEHIQLVLDKI